MADQNLCLFTGRLGRDPEERFTQSGDAVCNFSIAVSEKYKDKAGDQKENTVWINCVAWRKLAEICAQYLKKGSFVRVAGKLTNRQWEDKDGNKRNTTEIVLSEMQMLSPAKSAESEEPVTNDNNTGGTTDGFEEIPF